MRFIDPTTIKQIKARSMKGFYKPSHEIFIEGEVGDRIPFWEGSLNKIIQGYDSTSNARISNYVPTNDARQMCTWAENVPEIGNRVVIGYTSSEEKYLTENYPIEETYVTDIEVDVLEIAQISLYKRDDGKVLLFLKDRRGGLESMTLNCYISEVGNGQDLSLLSNVYTNNHNPSRGYPESHARTVNIPLRTKTGRLILTFGGSWYRSWAWGSVQALFIVTSDDDGATWVTRRIISQYNHAQCIGQPVQLPDNSLYVEAQMSSGANYIFKSSSDGDGWTNMTHDNEQQFRYSFSDANKGATWPGGVWAGSFFYDGETDKAYRVVPGTYAGCGIYALDNPTQENFLNKSEWKFLLDIHSNTNYNPKIWVTPKNRLAVEWGDVGNVWQGTGRTVILGFTFPDPTPIHAKSIEITRNENMGGQLNISFDNKEGFLSPDPPGEFHKFFWPGKKIWLRQGYGEDMPYTYKGFIDDINIISPPQTVTLFCRDYLSLALDQYITSPTGSRVNRFMVQAVEDVFRTLATWAGFESIITEPTGMILLDKTFSWDLCGDGFSWLADLVGFEWYCDEEGTMYFQRPKDRQPEATELHTLIGVEWVDLGQEQVATYSERVRKLDNTPCVRGTDYEIDYGFEEPFQASLRRIETSNIASGEQIRISYVYPAYTFVEGEDIAAIDYKISRRELYAEVIVFGQGANDEVIYASTVPQIQQYGVQKDKVLPIHAQDAKTYAECKKIADRTARIIETRARAVTFLTIGVPHLQKGDCIRVLEHTTSISEIYRIIDLGTSMDDNGYLGTMSCYHYSHAHNPV